MLSLVGRRAVCHLNRRVPSIASNIQSTASLSSVPTHWKQERVLSVITVGSMAAAVIVGPGVEQTTFALDMIMGFAIPLHTHWGFEQVVTDYVHGDLLEGLVAIGLLALFFTVTWQLFKLNMFGDGITKVCSDLWNIKPVAEPVEESLD